MTKKIILFVCFALTSCSVKYLRNQDDGLRPKKATFFKYKGDFKLSPSDNIDTNAIYVARVGPIWFGANDSCVNCVVYYRFYSTGQLYISPAHDSIPGLTEINNIKTGNCGYYKIADNKINLEFIYYVDRGSRKTDSGHIENGNLVFYEKNKTIIWTKTIIKGLTHTKPDW